MTGFSSIPNERFRDEVSTALDQTRFYEASYSGNIKRLKRLLNLSYIREQISYPDHEWGHRTALHLAAAKGKKCCWVRKIVF